MSSRKRKITGDDLLHGAEVNNAIVAEYGGGTIPSELGVDMPSVMQHAKAYGTVYTDVPIAFATGALSALRAVNMMENENA